MAHLFLLDSSAEHMLQLYLKLGNCEFDSVVRLRDLKRDIVYDRINNQLGCG